MNKSQDSYNALHATVTGVRDDMETCIQGIKSHHLRGWANAITAALDAAPAPPTPCPVCAKRKHAGELYRESNALLLRIMRDGDPTEAEIKRYDEIGPELDDALSDAAPAPGDGAPYDDSHGADSACETIKRTLDITLARAAGYKQGFADHASLCSPPPAPVGIDREAVAKVRDKARSLYVGNRKATLPWGDVQEIVEALTALIEAAGEQVPVVALSVVDELERKFYAFHVGASSERDKVVWLDASEYVKEALAPHRTAPPAASEQVCKKCGGDMSLICDCCKGSGVLDPWEDESMQTQCPKCKGLGETPCPDCATAPRTPTTEQRAAHIHEKAGQVQHGKCHQWGEGAVWALDVTNGKYDKQIVEENTPMAKAKREGGGDGE